MKIWKKDYYERLFMKRAQTVQDYQLIIAEAQERIRQLQGQCTHQEYTVMFHSWRPGALLPAHICNQCSSFIKEATEEESKKLWDEFHGNQQVTSSDFVILDKKQ